MPDHYEVYKSKAEMYELLISREDYLNEIPQNLTNICTFEGADIIDKWRITNMENKPPVKFIIVKCKKGLALES